MRRFIEFVAIKLIGTYIERLRGSISDLFVNHVLRFTEGISAFPANPYTRSFYILPHFNIVRGRRERERVTKVVETELTSGSRKNRERESERDKLHECKTSFDGNARGTASVEYEYGEK